MGKYDIIHKTGSTLLSCMLNAHFFRYAIGQTDTHAHRNTSPRYRGRLKCPGNFSECIISELMIVGWRISIGYMILISSTGGAAQRMTVYY